MVAQLLYPSKLSCINIQLEVSLLCTRVSDPDVDDSHKLARVMKYVRGTIGLPLIMPIEKYGNIKWSVDAEFAVHKYMRTHTGGFLKRGTGGAYV